MIYKTINGCKDCVLASLIVFFALGFAVLISLIKMLNCMNFLILIDY